MPHPSSIIRHPSSYLITGGAGFIGSFVCERLLAEGHRVICVDNFLTGQRKNIKHLQTNKNFTLIEADITEVPGTSTWKFPELPKLDYILHLASPAGPNPKSPKSYHALPVETYLVNSIGTHYLLELAKETGATLLFASTSEIYGDPDVHPQPETYHGNVNPIGPRAIYDESKRLGEAMCALWSRKFGVQTRIARIFNTYGPRMNPEDGRAIPLFILAALQAEGIGTGVHFTPVHLHPYYKKTFGYKPGDFPHAERIGLNIFSLPIYPTMSKNDVNDVINAILKLIKYYQR